MQIFAEVLTRLGCVNVAVMGGDMNQGDQQDSLDIKCDENKIWVGGKEFLVPGTELDPTSISGLTFSQEGVSFRLKLKQNEKLPTLITPAKLNYGGRLKFPAPEIVSDQTYILVCQCGAELGSITPARVLPLPSASWQADSLDWYCCVNKLNKAPVLKPRTADLLYNSYSFVVDIANMIEGAVNKSCVTKEETPGCEEEITKSGGNVSSATVNCKACDSELGSLVRDSLQIWCSSVKLRSGDLCLRSNKEVETVQDSFKIIINGYVIESISAMPKVMIRNRQGKSVVLWIIDKDLTVARSENEGVVKESVMKVLFKDGNDVPDNIMEILELSDSIFDVGLQLMEKSTENFPDCFKVANEFKVSYLPKV